MLKISNLSKKYFINKYQSVDALNGINLEFSSRGLIFVVGKSGCGKTTLLNLIGNLDEPSEGDISFCEQNINNLSEKDKASYRNKYVSFIFQENNLIEFQNVKKNIELSLAIQNKKISNDEINKILCDVNLEGFLYRKVEQLSSGQKQRIAIARALAKESSIILCDEPTGSLDYETSESIIKLLKSISKKCLIIVVTHDLELANKYGDRIIQLKDGKLISDVFLNNDLKVTSYPTKIDLNQNKLSLYKKFDFAKSYINTKKIRLFLTCVISVLLLCLVSISSSYYSFERNKVILNSLYKQGQKYVSFEYNENIENYGEIIHESSRNISKDEAEKITSNFPEFNFDYVYEYYDCDLKSHLVNVSNLKHTKINGFIELGNDFINKYNLQLYGRLPSKNLLDNEVVITKSFYELFNKFGFLSKDSKEYVINSYDDIIEKEIELSDSYLSNKSFKIVGVLDTKRLDKNINSRTLHNLIFFREGFYKDNISIRSTKLFSDSNNNFLKIDFENKNYNFNDGIGNISYALQKQNYNSISVIDNNENVNIYYFEEGKKELNNNEMILPLNKTNIFIDFDGMLKNYILGFSYNNYSLIRDSFTDAGYSDNYLSYCQYIINNRNNEFQPEYNYDFFKNSYLSTIWEILNENKDINLSIDFNIKKINKKYKIVGYYFNANENDIDDQIYVNKQSFEELVDYFGKYGVIYNDDIKSPKYDIKYIFTSLSNNFNKDIKLLNYQNKVTQYTQNKDELTGFVALESYCLVYTELTSLVISSEYTLKSNAELFKYILIAVLFISITFMYYYFSGIIQERQKDIGILKANGASNNDVIGIFLIQIMIISSILIFFSILSSIFFVNLINNLIINYNNFMISLLNISLVEILLIIVVQLLTSLLGILIPLTKLLKKSPIKIIKSNNIF